MSQNKIKREIIKARDMWSDSHVFVSNCGNGKAVPQYELNEKGEVVYQRDKDGKIITHNLYKDIQSMKGVTDYKKIIQMNGGDLSVFVDNNQQVQDIDATKFGSLEEVLNASAKCRSQGLDINAVEKAMHELLEKMRESKSINSNVQNVIKKENPAPIQKKEESVLKNENDKEKK